MSIKPIDLQTSIGQMHEVAKGEQGRSAALVEQQHVLEKESNEKSNLVNSRLEENKKAEKTVIMKEEERGRGRRPFREKEKNDSSGRKTDEEEALKDDRMGLIIDIRK
jgi:hypothetical protein